VRYHRHRRDGEVYNFVDLRTESELWFANSLTRR
jgi:hypothetical protein